jgi:hypothetical protein
MARPMMYSNETQVAVTGREARTNLQQNSERRAIINAVIDNRGKMTLGQLDDHFGYDVRSRVISLVKSGWLEIQA